MATLFGGDGGAKRMQAQQLAMQQEQQKRLDAQEVEKQRQMAAMAAARRSGGMRQLMAGQTDLGQAGTSTLGTGS